MFVRSPAVLYRARSRQVRGHVVPNTLTGLAERVFGLSRPLSGSSVQTFKRVGDKNLKVQFRCVRGLFWVAEADGNGRIFQRLRPRTLCVFDPPTARPCERVNRPFAARKPEELTLAALDVVEC